MCAQTRTQHVHTHGAHTACQAALDQLGPVSTLKDPASLAALPPSSLFLLGWLLLPRTRKKLHAAPVDYAEFAHQLQHIQPGVQAPVFEANHQPTAIFALDKGPAQSCAHPVVAYHGTTFENLHSILNSGVEEILSKFTFSTGFASLFLHPPQSVASRDSFMNFVFQQAQSWLFIYLQHESYQAKSNKNR